MTFWECLTSPDLGAVDRGVPVVLPIGAVEQHGPHLPVGTDRIVAEAIASDLDSRVGADALVLPPIAVGCSDHHTDFPGTLTLRHTTLLRHVEDVARSVLAQGFTTFLLLNAHGGNQGIGQVAIERLGARHPRARVLGTSWWRLAGPELLEISETGPGGVGHACELETSMMLAIAPGLVRTDRIPDRQNEPAIAFDDSDMLRGSRATLYRRLIDVAPTGVFGEPKAASAEKGELALTAIGDRLEELVRAIR
ncbi:MAG TPA: creatininase family protein [Actinokineospora sp.]|jgi:creatinine amidohydrolase|nr:creatininase family protein [Actinokineospora sp.]